jgi:hypothetical protein
MVLPFLLNIHFLSILPYVLTLLAIAMQCFSNYSSIKVDEQEAMSNVLAKMFAEN